ncbi:hypothetical protein A3K63_01205 [Candidatus Micrarchaeota archaeon RBG_16_49_10]|nr:MAG: hypothetical protein A3K63_01205 [Candidatus Micrarchaeota archaeon RBG_16_49_10]
MMKKQLAIVLSRLKPIEDPDPDSEQYTIPGDLAAEILNLAHLAGDIEGKTVIDLGCGSGRLVIGALILGAGKAIAVDKYNAVIKTAKENVKMAEEMTSMRFSDKIEFITSDVSEAKLKGDTVIQNPPFGIQKEHSDRAFLEKALESAGKVYSLHRSYHKSRDFIQGFVEQRKGEVGKIIKFKFRIPYMFRFHRKRAVEFDVDLFVIKKVK